MGGQEVVQMTGGAAASLFAAALTSNGIALVYQLVNE
jgi:hypothetical protein